MARKPLKSPQAAYPSPSLANSGMGGAFGVTVGASDDFGVVGGSDLFDASMFVSGDVELEIGGDFEPVDLDDAVSELREEVENAVDFMQEAFSEEWEDAEAFYNGKSNVPKVAGRSQVTATVLRDTVRSLKPSLMRVFVASDKIVEYTPVRAPQTEGYYNAMAVLADGQTAYNNQLFWLQRGYEVLQDAMQDALLKRFGIIRAYKVDEVSYKHLSLERASAAQVMGLQEFDDIVITALNPLGASEGVAEGAAEFAEEYAVEFSIKTVETKIAQDHVPLFEFFVDEAATCVEDARVIGQRRQVTVGEAIEMGLEYDDWDSLDTLDPETHEHAGESHERRKHIKSRNEGDSAGVAQDSTRRLILLTCVYAKFDLKGLGVPQLYKFYLGGTNYAYIAHEPMEHCEYSRVVIDPQPAAFAGVSIFDILKEDQNTQTSLLRATVDNAHAANNPRLAAHETLVNFSDLMSTRIGAPIRTKAAGQIQEVAVRSTTGTMMPLLQYLSTESNTKVGVTDASLGLDPDALQSTDKDAVKNTIQLSQGQVELMARNIAAIGLGPHFRKMLRLSIEHLPEMQMLASAGGATPISQKGFNPELDMEVCVGLGTADFDLKLAGLNVVLEKQTMMMEKFGLQNPMVSVQQVYNTVADIIGMMGITNTGRYFSAITPEAAQQLAQQQAATAQKEEEFAQQQAAAAANALVQAEQIKAQNRIMVESAKADLDIKTLFAEKRAQMVELLMRDDLERDKMAQQLAIEDAKLEEGGTINREKLRMEQEKRRNPPAAPMPR